MINWYIIKNQGKICGDVKVGNSYIYRQETIKTFDKKTNIISTHEGHSYELNPFHIDKFFKREDMINRLNFFV